MSNSNLKPYADIKAKVREYTDKDGKTKGVYIQVGTLFASPHLSHMSIKLDSVPVGEWNGWLGIYKRDDAEQQVEPDTATGSISKPAEISF